MTFSFTPQGFASNRGLSGPMTFSFTPQCHGSDGLMVAIPMLKLRKTKSHGPGEPVIRGLRLDLAADACLRAQQPWTNGRRCRAVAGRFVLRSLSIGIAPTLHQSRGPAEQNKCFSRRSAITAK